MQNPGVLCYRNSVLQALLHSPKFVNWLEEDHIICGMTSDDVRGRRGAPRCIAYALRVLCVVYWARDAQPAQVTRALNALQVVLYRGKFFARRQPYSCTYTLNSGLDPARAGGCCGVLGLAFPGAEESVTFVGCPSDHYVSFKLTKLLGMTKSSCPSSPSTSPTFWCAPSAGITL